jgi:hypothetical protein
VFPRSLKICLLCLCWVLFSAARPAHAQSHFTLDALKSDQLSGALANRAYAELVFHLDNTLGARFILKVVPTRRALQDRMQSSTRAHFVLLDGSMGLPSADYVLLHRSVEEVSGVIVVPATSKVQRLQDLDGRNVLANREHLAAGLILRLAQRQNVTLFPGGGNGLAEQALSRHYGQFGGREALLTSAVAAEQLMQEQPGRFRLLPETESGPRWQLAGLRTLADGVNEGLVTQLRETTADLSPSTRKLLPQWASSGKRANTATVAVGR